jgi:tetratricopeptide (TPR) repeat protein
MAYFLSPKQNKTGYYLEFYRMATRLEQLQSFFNEDPYDPFNIYGLALEYMKTDVEKSVEYFEKLLEEHPDYIPTYYHAGKLFESIGERNKAITTFEQGILRARTSNEIKALRELQAAHQELIFE